MLHDIKKKILNNNLVLRFLSAALLIPIAIYIFCYGGAIIYTCAMLVLSLLMFNEWVSIIETKSFKHKLYYTFWYSLGILYILLFFWSMISIFIAGFASWVVLIVITTDTAAFFIGKSLQGPKLCRRISEHKTWSGLIGGILASAAVGFFVYENSMINNGMMCYFFTKKEFILYSSCLAIIAQFGDLLASSFKRYFGVKDSGTIIPGHGGVLDRIDGLVTASFAAVLLQNIF